MRYLSTSVGVRGLFCISTFAMVSMGWACGGDDRPYVESTEDEDAVSADGDGAAGRDVGPMGETDRDAGPDTGRDTGGNDEPEVGSSCVPSCEAYGDHSVAECVDGTCEYRCETGWVDANGDFLTGDRPDSDSDGCEYACEESNGGEEICDGEDNDCDGETDEGFDVGASCRVGEGACEAEGEKVCASEGGGTTCNVSPGEPMDETCGDGVDNDCDGEVDEDDAVDAETWYEDGDGDGYGATSTETTACEKPDGYVAEGGDCDDENADVHPDVVDDEDWQCNGVDDDCDGTVDEACCGSAGNNPEPDVVRVGTVEPEGDDWPFGDIVSPAFAEATSNAPSDAVGVVAWMSAPSEISLVHLDATGAQVDGVETVTTNERLVSLAITPTDRGYELTYATYRNRDDFTDTDSWLFTRGLGADLTPSVNPVELRHVDRSYQTVGNCETADGCWAVAFDNLDVEFLNDRVLLTFSEQIFAVLLTSARVSGYKWNVNDRANSFDGLDFSGSRGGDVQSETYPVVTANDSAGFGVAWMDGDNDAEKIYGVTYDSTMTATGSFGIDVADSGSDAGERIDAVWRGSDELVVTTPDYSGSEPKIVAKVVEPGTGTLVSSTDLTTSNRADTAPIATGRDTDGDGFADHGTVVWRRTRSSGDELLGSDVELGSLGSFGSSGRLRFPTDGVGEPSLVDHEKGVGALWVLDQASNHEVEYVSLSDRGVGICQPNP